MELLTAGLVFVLFAGGFYLLLQRSLFNVVLGLALCSHASLMVMLAGSGWNVEAGAPILEDKAMVEMVVDGEEVTVSRVDTEQYVDPLPQALILTAIVIGFGLLSFFMVLVARTYESTGTIEAGELPRENET